MRRRRRRCRRRRRRSSCRFRCWEREASLPSPPRSVSLPEPPSMSSLPAPPSIVSLPSRALGWRRCRRRRRSVSPDRVDGVDDVAAEVVAPSDSRDAVARRRRRRSRSLRDRRGRLGAGDPDAGDEGGRSPDQPVTDRAIRVCADAFDRHGPGVSSAKRDVVHHARRRGEAQHAGVDAHVRGTARMRAAPGAGARTRPPAIGPSRSRLADARVTQEQLVVGPQHPA